MYYWRWIALVVSVPILPLLVSSLTIISSVPVALHSSSLATATSYRRTSILLSPKNLSFMKTSKFKRSSVNKLFSNFKNPLKLKNLLRGSLSLCWICNSVCWKGKVNCWRNPILLRSLFLLLMSNSLLLSLKIRNSFLTSISIFLYQLRATEVHLRFPWVLRVIIS